SINYRFLEENETIGVLKPLNDSKRALQFIRHFSEELNIDKDKIILVGSSAGAGTSLWIGFNDEMAEPNSSDPILRESTRVSGIVALSTQATYDVTKWHQTVFHEYEPQGMEFSTIVQLVGESTLLKFYGMSHINDLSSNRVQEDIAKLDMLQLL